MLEPLNARIKQSEEQSVVFSVFADMIREFRRVFPVQVGLQASECFWSLGVVGMGDIGKWV